MLEIEDVGRIENPTTKQLRDAVVSVGGRSPFVILSGDNDEFMQTVSRGADLRIEHWKGGKQRCVVVDLEQAAELFESFRLGDGEFDRLVTWKSETVLTDPYSTWTIILLIVLFVGFIAWGMIDFFT